jgi:dTDP-4-amino-4,6-dideoxygalactose transaminase
MSHEPIPFLDLITVHRELEQELVEAFRESLRSAAFIGGKHVEGFEREFAAFCGSSHCVGVASGTDALRFALMACGVGAGDAVVTVAHTFIATVEAISQTGATTEFVDIDDRTYTMSADALAAYLQDCEIDSHTGRPVGRRTGRPIKAIVPVHLYGQVADMDTLTAVADRYNLLVVEDACQAHGAEYKSRDGWRRAGSMGVAAAFSFYPGKNLGACGEAGAITTNDSDVARVAKMLRDHGQVRKYFHDLEGYNGRLDAIQATFLRIKLQHLEGWNASRREAARRYNVLLSSSTRNGRSAVTIPFEPEWSRAVYHLYVISVADRDDAMEFMKTQHIGTGLHYPVPVHLQNCYKDWGYQRGSLPVTERAAAEILSLPMFPGLATEQQARVVTAIEAFASRATAAVL